jgi:hypothetical protein
MSIPQGLNNFASLSEMLDPTIEKSVKLAEFEDREY